MDNLLYSEKEKREAREALLKYYYSECVAHGTYILTVAIGIFAFIQVLPYLKFQWEILQEFITSLVLTIFLLIGVYFFARIILWATLATTIFWIKPLDCKEAEQYFPRNQKNYNLTLLLRFHLASGVSFKERRKLWSLLKELSWRYVILGVVLFVSIFAFLHFLVAILLII